MAYTGYCILSLCQAVPEAGHRLLRYLNLANFVRRLTETRDVLGACSFIDTLFAANINAARELFALIDKERLSPKLCRMERLANELAILYRNPKEGHALVLEPIHTHFVRHVSVDALRHNLPNQCSGTDIYAKMVELLQSLRVLCKSNNVDDGLLADIEKVFLQPNYLSCVNKEAASQLLHLIGQEDLKRMIKAKLQIYGFVDI